MRTGSERSGERGKGLTWVLAALGALLIGAALALPTLKEDGGQDDGGPGQQQGTAMLVERRPGAPSQNEGPETEANPTAGARVAGPPGRLSIPALGVLAPVTAVDLHGSTLVPPDNPQVLGWWRSGGVPGAARGTTVITGHTVHTGGGAFDDLADLQRGDVLHLTTASGTLDYRVRKVMVLSKGALATHAKRLFSQSTPGRLALVTCENWNGQTHDSNTIVLAAPTEN